VVLVVAGGLDLEQGLFEIPGSLCWRWLPGSVSVTISCTGFLRAPFPLFSRVYRIVERKCRIVRGFFLISLCFFTSENAVFLMGEYRTVPAGGWGGGCGSCGTDFGAKTGLIFKSAEISVSGSSLDRAG